MLKLGLAGKVSKFRQGELYCGRQGGHVADNELSLGRQGIVGCCMAI